MSGVRGNFGTLLGDNMIHDPSAAQYLGSIMIQFNASRQSEDSDKQYSSIVMLLTWPLNFCVKVF